MIRIFSHFVSGRVVLLFVLEALVLMLSGYVGLQFHLMTYGGPNPGLARGFA